MHSPTLALSWQLWGRHRRALAAFLLYLIGTAVVFNALPAGTVEDWHGGLLSIQFVLGLIYVAAIFAYGFESRLEAPESGFPARLFTLPVRTSMLVGWPMLQGMAAVALLWLAWAYFVLRPSGIEVSLGSTTLLAAAFVAVLQALLWSPFGLPWVRVVLAVVLLPLLALAPLLGPLFGLSGALLLGLYAGLIPVGAVMAFLGVSRARHGVASDWRRLFRVTWTNGRRLPRRPDPFSSAARAHFWLEWRRHFVPFPLVAGALALLTLTIVLPDETPPRPNNLIRFGMNFVIYPLILAPFFGCFLGRTGHSGGNPYRLSSFTATRPLSSAALVAAKLKVAGLLTLTTWGLMLLAATIWLVKSGHDKLLSQLWSDFRQANPPGRVVAITLLAVGGPMLLTWRLLVDNLWIGLTGRAWLVRVSLVACGACLPLAFILLARVGDTPGLGKRLWDALPWYAGGAALVKLLAAGCVGFALLQRGLARPQTLAMWLGVWLLAAVGLFVLAYEAAPVDVVPVSVLVSAAVLGVPLVRLAAAPLALDWNRHR
jgi:hypothetical protein